MGRLEVRSVAIIGGGASGAAAAAAFAAEDYYDRIRVFERRETPGGTWIYDPDPGRPLEIHPGQLPPETDPSLNIPDNLPTTTEPLSQERYQKTPIYAELTTNVPAIAMSFSDLPFAYGPFVPHWVAKQYIENYFSAHRTDSSLVLNTTVEDVSKLPKDRWSLTLRRNDPVRHMDVWWKEEFDAIVVANGHYTVPYIPEVKGLEDYMQRFPGRVIHSKAFRSAAAYQNQRVLIIGNSASGHDITTILNSSSSIHHPIYQSRRSSSRWDDSRPPPGIIWKPVITSYLPDGTILFSDSTILSPNSIDVIIYCTGYKPSFPFWNSSQLPPLYSYETSRLLGSYLHTFFPHTHPTLGIIGIPRTLTFRSFEYQAIALARLFSNRNTHPLPSSAECAQWEMERETRTKKEGRPFHDVPWENGETIAFFQELYRFAGLPEMEGGKGRCPPVLGREVSWAVENVRKYPEPGREDGKGEEAEDDLLVGEVGEEDWVKVKKGRDDRKDILHFI